MPAEKHCNRVLPHWGELIGCFHVLDAAGGLIHTPQTDFGFNQTNSSVRIVLDQILRVRGLIERFGIMIRSKRKQEEIVVCKRIVGIQA